MLLYPIRIQIKKVCLYYVARIVCDIDSDIKTPLWMREQLRHSRSCFIRPCVIDFLS